MDQLTRDMRQAIFLARPNCGCIALPNGAEEKSPAKASKYKAKYDKCCAKRKSKGKGCWPKEPGSSFLGITSDCRNDYKKWQKWAPVADKSLIPEAAGGKPQKPKGGGKSTDTGIEDTGYVETEEGGLSVGMAVGGLAIVSVIGLGALWYMSKS